MEHTLHEAGEIASSLFRPLYGLTYRLQQLSTLTGPPDRGAALRSVLQADELRAVKARRMARSGSGSLTCWRSGFLPATSSSLVSVPPDDFLMRRPGPAWELRISNV